MDFDFLPNLPKSNLDDRTFRDLVEECLLRIPRYCPEWTHYNPSDPGITMIELFSWLTDQMLLRFNQVPRRHYVTFLELLGIRLQSATPAQTDLTFYLTTALSEPYTIPQRTEVATERTETEAAIVFSTDRPLTIACPELCHFLTADSTEDVPQLLHDRLRDVWTQRPDGQWEGREQNLFNEQPESGNCFYLVFDADQPLDGNVLAVTFRGEAATSTGINPDAPPRCWEAWNGQFWVPVLLRDRDDTTRGFSFSELARQGGNPLQGADIILHMPSTWPVTQFLNYRGCWVRCTYVMPDRNQPGYLNSPRVVGLGVRAIGGTTSASQSVLIQNELLGESDGTPGQTWPLQGSSILPREANEHLLVTPPGELPQIWQEVPDFANSGPDDLHYTLDAITGTIQFGPLIREPGQIKQQTQLRARVQGTATALPSLEARTTAQMMDRQYGAVPPRGSTLKMVAYRTGGGQKGNVQAGTLKVMKSSIPYVATVINHRAAYHGTDPESLEDAVIRVPQLLRTRDRAVTPEDFQTLAIQAGEGAVARALCPPISPEQEAGTVRLLIVPQANLDGLDRGEGIPPSDFDLTPELRQKILAYLDDRKLLGTQVKLETPKYTGVAVQTEVALESAYHHPEAREEVLRSLRSALYRFLNPLVGGPEGKGWNFGRPVYPSDIVTVLQQNPYVRYLGAVQLIQLTQQNGTWQRQPAAIINPGPLGLICSWAGRRLGHVVDVIQE